MAEKRRVYLDNAATTMLAPEVVTTMTLAMNELYGNPSSIHHEGRRVRSALEKARRSIATTIGCTPAEIFFTSGGTEADNMAIQCAVRDLKVETIISSELEHHAVLHTLHDIEARGWVKLMYVAIDSCGRIDMAHLEKLLSSLRPGKTLVSLMHANNETGTLLDMKATGELCRNYGAFFHSDTVQTIGHYKFDLKNLPVDIITCAAHKFHGPKGAGFIYIRNTLKLKSFIHGGSQERNMRGGTENVYGILGLNRALELAMAGLDEHQLYITGLKLRLKERLCAAGINFKINGAVENDESLYTILNISVPAGDLGDMLLFNLDIYGVSASGGSACSSGSEIGSHVLAGLGVSGKQSSVRFSFSRYTLPEEIDYAADKLIELVYLKEPAISDQR